MQATDDIDFLRAMGARIKGHRLKNNLTQYELAMNCGFEPASISRIEAGKINITVLTLFKISNSLVVSISDIV